jgi:hypothetical protein
LNRKIKEYSANITKNKPFHLKKRKINDYYANNEIPHLNPLRTQNFRAVNDVYGLILLALPIPDLEFRLCVYIVF